MIEPTQGTLFGYQQTNFIGGKKVVEYIYDKPTKPKEIRGPVKKVMRGQRLTVWNVILGMTTDFNANDISRRCDLEPHKVLKRLPELRRSSLIIETDERREGQRVYKLWAGNTTREPLK